MRSSENKATGLRLPVVLLILLLTLLQFSCAGDNSGTTLSAAQPEVQPLAVPGLTLPWPPPDGTAKLASDDEISFMGAEFSASGGNAVIDVQNVVLTGKEPISYAMYSAGLFSNLLDFEKLRVNFTLDLETDPEQAVYVGLANYALERWQFYPATPGGMLLNVPQPANYISPSGMAHAVLVNWGAGSSTVQSIDFLRKGPTSTDIPQNLRAEAFVGEIQLEWDSVVPCFGYNVYRATDPQFSDPVKLNEGLVFDTNFRDVEATTHQMWYYRVTAVYALESGMSNMVDIFSPRDDRPLPTNFRVTAQTLTTITLEWDWAGEDPFQWKVYWKGEKDFNLFPPIAIKNQPGFARKSTLDNLVPGETIYFRIASMANSGNLGRMTDDLETSTRNLYEWVDVEEIGVGTWPFDAIVADGEMSCTYLEQTEEDRIGPFGPYVGRAGIVRLGRRDAGTWTMHNVSHGRAFDEWDNGGVPVKNSCQYYEFIDIAHSSEGYLISSHTKFSDDIWIFSGNPGEDWNAHLLDGDGEEHPGHPAEGRSLRIASNGDEYAALYWRDPMGREVVLRRRDVGADPTVWDSLQLIDSGLEFIHYHSMDYDPLGQLSVMYLDLSNGALKVAKEQDNFTFFSVLSEDHSYVGAYNDIHYIDGHWFSSTYRGSDEKLMLVSDESFPWQVSQVSYRKIEAGNHSRLSSFQGLPLVLYYGTPPEEYHGAHQRWYFGLYEEGGWHTEWVQIEGYEDYVFGPEAEMLEFDGDLYFFFEDRTEELEYQNSVIKCARAVPPQL